MNEARNEGLRPGDALYMLPTRRRMGFITATATGLGTRPDPKIPPVLAGRGGPGRGGAWDREDGADSLLSPHQRV